jgi:spore maturation protein CgeB
MRVWEFFFHPARQLQDKRFLIGGNGWETNVLESGNVNYLGHVYTRDHNAFNCTPMAVLNITRESMVRYGYSPPTRVFEAAGAGACLITDAWEGIEMFLEPERECLVAQSGDHVIEVLQELDAGRARAMGEAARERVLSEHTYAHRAAELDALLEEARARTAA